MFKFILSVVTSVDFWIYFLSTLIVFITLYLIVSKIVEEVREHKRKDLKRKLWVYQCYAADCVVEIDSIRHEMIEYNYKEVEKIDRAEQQITQLKRDLIIYNRKIKSINKQLERL